MEHLDPLTQHAQSSGTSATFGSDKEAQWVLIYGHGTTAMTHRSRSSETHAEHPSIGTAIHKPHITKLLGG